MGRKKAMDTQKWSGQNDLSCRPVSVRVPTLFTSQVKRGRPVWSQPSARVNKGCHSNGIPRKWAICYFVLLNLCHPWLKKWTSCHNSEPWIKKEKEDEFLVLKLMSPDSWMFVTSPGDFWRFLLHFIPIFPGPPRPPVRLLLLRSYLPRFISQQYRKKLLLWFFPFSGLALARDGRKQKGPGEKKRMVRTRKIFGANFIGISVKGLISSIWPTPFVW